jgi:hypothetical protein
MLRRSLVVGIVAVGLVGTAADLTACGDKFLRAGRSSRMRNYAAEYPASILIYKPANARAKGLKEWQKALAQAGHTSHVVENGQAFVQAVADGKYDLVIADYAEAGKIKSATRSLPSNPTVLPIVHKPAKAVPPEVKKEFDCLIHAEMDKFDTLAEIDHVMELRLKSTSASAK